MFSNIVVGTDGSDTAKAAVALAMTLARQDDATVHIVHAVKASTSGMPISKAGSNVVYDADVVAAKAIDETADPVLTEATADAGGVTVRTYAAGSAPADAMIEVAERVGADLIVVGSKGMQGVRRVIGSVPNSVAHGAPCHVLIAKTA